MGCGIFTFVRKYTYYYNYSVHCDPKCAAEKNAALPSQGSGPYLTGTGENGLTRMKTIHVLSVLV